MSSQTVQTELFAAAQGCPKCGGTLDSSGRETHCENCGLVTEADQIDHGPEWRTYNREKQKRTGAPRTATRHDRGLSTNIGSVDSADIPSRRRRRLARQRRLHGRSKYTSKRDRNLAHGLGEVRRIASALSESRSVKEQASTFFREAQDADLLIGRSIEGGAAAAVYAACRCNGLVTMETVADVARCSASHAWNCYRTFLVELELPIPVSLPVDWVARICSDLPLDVAPEVRQRALELAEQATESAEVNGRPDGVAAGALYLAGQELDIRLTQATISEPLDVHPETIRQWFQQIEEHIVD
ncbi:transcription initiation factor IIB family protein [Haloarcula sp. H-GB4]|uniref:transcription initiation factor IIB n=1 Tax=Haloarcula sp. H-GB4 TaxID=3069755 RepID=UPI0027B57234|nr:transcription initiation factor IIB family protein [Haloarcula sp. H-GB4]MDQ2074970.1 transcription initiation factor IIB family protein [Haloarcula sp. H-GB4]